MKKLKRIGIIILVLWLLLFAFSNTEKAEITFFPGLTSSMPLALLILVSVLVGFVLGVFVALNVGKDKKPTEPQIPQPPVAVPPPDQAK